jgi:hypothetical protein
VLGELHHQRRSGRRRVPAVADTAGSDALLEFDTVTVNCPHPNAARLDAYVCAGALGQR